MFFSAPLSTILSISATLFTPPTSAVSPVNMVFNICDSCSTCCKTSGLMLSIVAMRVATSTCISGFSAEIVAAALSGLMWAKSKATVWGCSLPKKDINCTGSMLSSILKPVVRMLFCTFSKISRARREPSDCSRICCANSRPPWLTYSCALLICWNSCKTYSRISGVTPSKRAIWAVRVSTSFSFKALKICELASCPRATIKIAAFFGPGISNTFICLPASGPLPLSL